MLLSKLLKAKKLFSISTGESIVDLVSNTFRFGESAISAGTAIVNEYETMRPDLISERIYSTQDYWDTILKYNGISNPFSLDFGEVLIMPAFNSIQTMIVPPREVVEKGIEPAKKNESKLITPKTSQDKKRFDSIRTKVPEIVPPNVNLSGVKNVVSSGGVTTFGANMTTTSSTSNNASNIRNRVQTQLKNTNNF
jgi:hypothetical protein